MPKAKLTGVPGGYEVHAVKMKGDKKYTMFLVYYVPDSLTGKKIPMRWRINSDEWARISGGKSRKGKVDRYMNEKQMRRSGSIFGGVSTELENLGKHPFSGAVHDYKAAARLRPWMKRNEMLSLWMEAYMEGREIRDSDLKQTNWWKRTTPEQRAWLELAHTDPKAAKARLQDNRYKVLKALEKAGMGNVPMSLVKYWADQYTHGKITDANLQHRIEVGSDPYVKNASVLAGITSGTLPERFVEVKHKGKMYLRTAKGDFELVGKGTQSRFGGIKAAKSVKRVRKVGANKQLARYLQNTGYGATVQGEDEVRQLVEEYVGPRQAEGRPTSFYGEWASKIRRDPARRDKLIKDLEKSAESLFANYGPGTKYSDIAPGYRQMFQEMWGEIPDETESFFWNQIQANDAQASMANLRREGINRGNAVQQQELARTALEASNNGIRGAA